MRGAHCAASITAARRQLQSLAGWLETNGHVDAAASLREGLEETLTVLALGRPAPRQRFFATTNCIENMIGTVRHVTRNIKRWRDGQMIRRWVGLGLGRAAISSMSRKMRWAPNSRDNASLRRPAAYELGKRVGREARKWMRRLMMLGLGLLALMALLTRWLVRSCKSETPEVVGLWRGDDGAPFEFKRADHDGERAYTVEAVLPDMTRLECNATPSYFGSLTMECQLLKAGVTDDRWRCEGLSILGSPPQIAGNCSALRNGQVIALKLRRAGK